MDLLGKYVETLDNHNGIVVKQYKPTGRNIDNIHIQQEIIENFESIRSYDESQFKIIEIIFRNGYKADSPKIKCKCKLNIGQGKEEWGAEPGKKYYVLEIIEVN